jgi:predicted GNAT family acetyltransferase
MQVQHQLQSNNGKFFIEEDGKEVAYMTYSSAGETKIIIDHTVVHPGNEGKGLGKKLVNAAVEYARAKHIKILPLCPFAKAVFDKTPAFSDVLFS